MVVIRHDFTAVLLISLARSDCDIDVDKSPSHHEVLVDSFVICSLIVHHTSGFMIRPVYFPTWFTAWYTASTAGLASARSNQACITHINGVNLKAGRDPLP